MHARHHIGWIDAWEVLHPTCNQPWSEKGPGSRSVAALQRKAAWAEEAGFTYDGQKNGMLSHNYRNRFDRCLIHSARFRVVSATLVGTEPLPGLSLEKTKRFGGAEQTRTLPVLASDHFGLLTVLEASPQFAGGVDSL